MKAVIMDLPKKMRVGDVPRPTPGETEVLVKIAAAGVCAGDLYIYHGKNPYAIYPCIGGHEMTGIIEEIGSSVDRFKAGQKVVIDPFIGCGKCYPCRVGKYNCCVNLRILGVHSPGGFAEYVSVPANKLYAVPENLSLAVAAFAEPIAIGIQACNRADVKSDDTVLVLGCGPIGMVTIEVAINRKARVIAADINKERLLIAAEMGAETIVSDENLAQKVASLTNNEGAPVVIEATGVAGIMEKTVELVASGGRIVIVGLVPVGVGVTFPGLDFTRKELTILGSRTNKNCFPEALELLRSKKILFPELAKSFNMWDAPSLFSQLSDNPGLYHKAVLINE
jgi:L-gulonate 5-dehydrogenase